MRVKYICCRRTWDVGNIPEIINVHPMRSMSECRFRFGHGGRSFLSPALYKSVSAKRIAMSGYMFGASSNFLSVPNNSDHLLRLSMLVHWYICCIVSGATTHRRQRLVVVCPCCCRIVIVEKVLLTHFVIKAMWTVVVSRARLNSLSSISSQSNVWARFQYFQCWSRPRLEISYAVDWLMLEWTGNLCIDMFGIPW